jgi:Ca2+-binding EF-hand superfamily protein
MSKYIYESTFKEYDKDNSGFIDYAELKALLESTFKKAGLTLTEEAIQYHVNKFDTSKDGKISLDEFCDKMDKYNHPA